jgi:hydrogenase maturation protease
MLKPPSVLAIGYGNPLRGDDGAGQRVVEILETWNLPNTRSLAVHQLTPEIAEDLAAVERVIFIDAYPAKTGEGAIVYSLDDEAITVNSTLNLGHATHPRSLLDLAQSLYNRAPKAWWVLVPGFDFEFGERLSEATQAGIDEALTEIKILIETV